MAAVAAAVATSAATSAATAKRPPAANRPHGKQGQLARLRHHDDREGIVCGKARRPTDAGVA